MSHPSELCWTLLSFATPFWATLQPPELRCTLLSYAAPCWATPHQAELRHTFMQISVARNFWHLLEPESSCPRDYLTRVKQTKVANYSRYFITLANESFRFGWSVLLFYSSNWVSLALSLIGGVHINLTCFGYIARLSQWGEGGYFTHSNDFYLPLLRLV